ncbi:MFS transporter [Glutamicibacter endophyticus]|uniref:MFS transporter n=1 Tax=Glutamicibacter endophyticus TaxID=1522174 RepID=UPI003AF194E1
MSYTILSQPDRELRRARAAVSALFLTNGAIFANLVPRLPELKASLGLGEASYGLLVMAWPLGAILAGLAAAALIRRWGSAPVAVIGTLLTALSVLAAGTAPGVSLVALALLCGGAMDAITDVGQNSHGLAVQRRYGRSILNSFHALWSVGAVLGGLMAAGALALRLPLGLHLGISALLFSVVSLTAWRFCLPVAVTRGVPEQTESQQPGDVAAAPRHSRLVLVMAALVLIAVSGIVVEDAGNSWAALYLGQSLDAPGPVAASGFIALVGAQFVGRLLGDGMVNRWGQRTVVQFGALLVVLGMGTALAWPSIAGSILGFAAAGFGVATTVPAAMAQADTMPGLKPGTGLNVVSWLMRLGFLGAPPLVGLVAESWGLRVALLVVPLVGLVLLLCSPVLPRRVHGKPRPVAE